MTDRPRPRLSLSLNGLSAGQLAVQTWKRMEGHDAMIWAAAIAFYALFATVPFLALFLVVTVLILPDLSGAGGRTPGLGVPPWVVWTLLDTSSSVIHSPSVGQSLSVSRIDASAVL